MRAYFRKAKYLCGMNKKEHDLVNLGQFENKTPRNNLQIRSLRSEEKFLKNQKGHWVREPHAISN